VPVVLARCPRAQIPTAARLNRDLAEFVARREEAERDIRHGWELRWTPDELREPLVIDIASLFDGLL
jgi:hypothetical protein